MKHFFSLFLYIGLFFCFLGTPLNAQETKGNGQFSTSTFMEIIRGGISGQSLLSESRGVGDWIKTPYGQIRLIGSDSGTDNLNQTWMALQVQINPGITLISPTLKLTQSKNIGKHLFFIYPPLPFEFDTKEVIYRRASAFPMLFELHGSNKPVQVTVEFSVKYCSENKCKESIQTANLDIPSGYNYYTLFSSYIDTLIAAIPRSAIEDKIQVGALSEYFFWIDAHLPTQDLTFLLLKAETSKIIPYTITQKIVSENRAFFIIKTEEDIQNQDMTLFLSADHQNFIKNGKIEKSPIPQIPLVNSRTHLPFYFWFIFLLISPSIYLLLKQQPRNEIYAQKESLKNIFCIMLGILCGIPIYLFFPYSTLSGSLLWLTFGSFLFMFLGFVNYPITSFGYGILTAIVPFFVFFNSYDVPIPESFLELASFFCCLAALNVLPYLILLFKPSWYVRIGKALKYNTDYKLHFPFFLSAFLFIFLLLRGLL